MSTSNAWDNETYWLYFTLALRDASMQHSGVVIGPCSINEYLSIRYRPTLVTDRFRDPVEQCDRLISDFAKYVRDCADSGHLVNIRTALHGHQREFEYMHHAVIARIAERRKEALKQYSNALAVNDPQVEAVIEAFNQCY